MTKLIAATLIVLVLNMGGCFTAMVYIDQVQREGFWHTKVTDVSRYEEMRERVARRASTDDMELLPEHIPPTSTETRMRAMFGKRYAGLTLYCKLTPDKARQFAEQARTRAAHVRRDAGKGALDEILGAKLPETFESIVWKTSSGGGLGSSFYGTSADLLWNEDAGVVIWNLMYHPPDPIRQQDSGKPCSKTPEGDGG